MATTKKRQTPARAKVDQLRSPIEELPRQAESLPGQLEIPGLAVDLPSVDTSGKLIPRPSLVPFLAGLDFDAFLGDWSFKEMRDKVKARYGSQRLTRVTAREFSAARKSAFSWWGCHRLRPMRRDCSLTEEQWFELKRVVSFFLERLQGLTIREAVRVVRTKISCNADVLRGLPSRFHVWR